jgi:hypothetical protein
MQENWLDRNIRLDKEWHASHDRAVKRRIAEQTDEYRAREAKEEAWHASQEAERQAQYDAWAVTEEGKASLARERGRLHDDARDSATLTSFYYQGHSRR